MTAPETEAGGNARSRVAIRLLPFLFLLYIANYLDRTNIAYAALGMKGDLGLTDSVFGTASGIFFIGYLALQIPGALLVERWSARLVLGLSLVVWGALTTMTGFVRTPGELYAARFFLGAAEASFFPGVVIYLSRWFVYQDRAKALSRFMAAIPCAYILSGPLAGSILGLDWLGITGWRWLFFLEGAPAIILGILTVFLLPERPEHVRWLRTKERDWLISRLDEERSAKANAAQETTWQVLRNPPVLLLTAGLFFCYTAGYAFWFWMPTMLQRLTGWADVQRIGWVGVLPALAGLVGMLVLGWNSDRTRERHWHCAIPQLLAAVALAALLILPKSNLLLIVIFAVVGFGTTAHLPSFWALPHSFLSSAAAAAAIGFISCVASIGGFLGPKIIGNLSQDSGSFRTGFIFMIGCWLIGAVLVLFCPRERRNTDALSGQNGTGSLPARRPGSKLIADHSGWSERFRLLRRARRSALFRLLRPSFAAPPPAVEPTVCEISTPDRYEEGLKELAACLSRPIPRFGAQRPGLERLLAEQRNSSGAIGMTDLLFLHAFVNVLAPTRIVEIGTLSGFSAAVIGDAAAEHQGAESESVLVDTIDLSERCFTDRTQPVGFQIPQLVPHLANRIRVHPGKDARHLAQIARPGELPLVFIDADHQHPRPTLDLVRVARFVRPGGWVLVHDIELGSLGEKMLAAGTPFEHGAPFGAQWLFEAWPFGKISGGNIGALRLPADARRLVPFALAMLRIPSELEPRPNRRMLQSFLAEVAELAGAV
jgi:ACS family tartrate transporter-like MFS transporter